MKDARFVQLANLESDVCPHVNIVQSTRTRAIFTRWRYLMLGTFFY